MAMTFGRRAEADNEATHISALNENLEDDKEASLAVIVVLALAVLFAFGGLVWLAYSQGIRNGRAEVMKIFRQPAPLDEGDTPAPAKNTTNASGPKNEPQFEWAQRTD